MAKNKLSLGTHPYTYARVSVMRSELLKKEEYHRLLKMSLNEIISFLQSSAYKKEIDHLGIKYSGMDLLEMALNSDLVITWNKLRRISRKELRTIIDSYLKRADIWNLKTILRGLHTGTKQETMSAMLLPAGQLSESKLSNLIKPGSVEEFLKSLPAAAGIKRSLIDGALSDYNEKKSIIGIENLLDREYYRRMIEFSKTIPSQGKLFKQFLDSEIEMLNTINILRLKRAGKTKAEIPAYVIGKQPAFLSKLILSESREETAKLLSLNGISESSAKSFIESDSVADIEIELGKSLLNKTRLLLHQNPLSVDVILGYMFAKEVEVKNLKMLLKSRQLNLEDEFVEKQIII